MCHLRVAAGTRQAAVRRFRQVGALSLCTAVPASDALHAKNGYRDESNREEEFSVVGFADGLVEELGAVERSLFDKERLDRICAADDPADLHVVAAGAAARDAHQIGAVTVDGHRGDYQALAAGGQSGRNRNLARFELPNRKTTSTGRLSRLNEALLKLVSPRRESVSRHYVRWHGNAARHVRQTHLSGK